MSPHVGGYSSGIVQHPYQQQSQAPYYYGQSQSNGMSPAPNANAYSFGANAQDVRASVPSNGVNHGAPFAGYHGQTPYNTLPAPPYPPIPKPYGAYSHAPQYPSQPPPRLNTVSAHPFPLSHLSGPQQSTNDNTAAVKPLSPALPELEDGEVDDAEPDNIVNHPEAASMGSRISRSSGGEQDESEGPRIAATHNNEVTQASQLAQGIDSHL